MPTYEFRCPEGHEFEKFYRSIGNAASVVACPTCGLIAERMMSAAGFAFKGSGFYLTDYGKNAHRGTDSSAAADGAKESGGDSTKSEASADSSTEAKSEAKSDGKSDGKSDSKSDSKSDAAKSSANSAAPQADAKKAESKAEAKPDASRPKPSASE